MAGHEGDDFDRARLARMERRLQSLEDAGGDPAISRRAMPPCAMTTMTRRGLRRCSPRMPPGTARDWAGSRVGRRSEVFSGARQGSSRSQSTKA